MIFGLLDSAVAFLEAKTGAANDQLKFVICLLACYPIGFAFKHIRPPVVRLSLGLLLGIVQEIYLYDFQVLFLLGLAFSSYVLMLIVGRKCGFIVTAYSLAYLSAFHIYRMYVDYGGWKLDISTTLMMAVPKICSVAWCYQDGRTQKKLSKEEEMHKLDRLPNIFEYMSYMLFYTTVVVGPFCDYDEFRDYIYHRNDYSNIPNPLWVSLRTLFIGLVSMGITATVLPKNDMIYTMTKEYREDPIWYQIYFLLFSGFLIRVKYFTVWYIVTANTMACGLSYNGRDQNGKPQWDRIWSASYRHEIQDNIRAKLEDWNHSVQEWLRRYIYLRVCSEEEGKRNPKKAVFASNVAFMVSAFWHGFYPGYYIGFLHLFLLQANSKFLYRAKGRLSWVPGPVALFFKHFLTCFFLDYCGALFYLLTLNPIFYYMHSTAYIPSILLIGTFVFFSVTNWGQKDKRPAAKKPEKAVEMADKKKD